MIPKVVRGNGFRGVLDYALKKEKGHLIGGNMLGLNPRELSAEFGFARQQNENKSNPVWHTSLSLTPGERLTDDQWRSATNKFMKQMGFTESHPFTVIKHEDTDHSHVHIIASTISYEGKSFKDSYEKMKAGAVCSKIELEYDLNLVDRRRSHKKHLDKSVLSELEQRLGNTPEQGKENLILSKNQREFEKRTGIKSAERKAFEALNEVLKKGQNLKLEDFVLKLSSKGVQTQVKRYQKSGKIQGLSFELEGYSFKASKLKRSWAQIKSKINYDEQQDLKQYKESKDGIYGNQQKRSREYDDSSSERISHSDQRESRQEHQRIKEPSGKKQRIEGNDVRKDRATAKSSSEQRRSISKTISEREHSHGKGEPSSSAKHDSIPKRDRGTPGENRRVYELSERVTRTFNTLRERARNSSRMAERIREIKSRINWNKRINNFKQKFYQAVKFKAERIQNFFKLVEKNRLKEFDFNKETTGKSNTLELPKFEGNEFKLSKISSGYHYLNPENRNKEKEDNAKTIEKGGPSR